MSEFTEAVDSYTAGLQFVSPGVCSSCEDCQRAYGQTAAQLEANPPCSEGGFSWRACETCGSSLGGDRHDAHAFDGRGELLHLSICTDCLCFFANGDEPQQWQ